MTTPRNLDISSPTHGWDHPWPIAFEVASVFPTANWTLIGGLMVQAHALAHGVPMTRPTEDLDMLLHIELFTGVAREAALQLGNLGFELQPPFNPRGPAYRYRRGVDVIDVMSPDHTGKLAQRLSRNPMFAVEGGKQALERSMTLTLTRTPGETITLSVPDELGALVLKGAAHLRDTRDRGRHLDDAATLAVCITDHATERARIKGSDGNRLRHLAQALADPRHRSWQRLPEPHRTTGRDTLRILTASRGTPPRRSS